MRLLIALSESKGFENDLKDVKKSQCAVAVGACESVEGPTTEEAAAAKVLVGGATVAMKVTGLPPVLFIRVDLPAAAGESSRSCSTRSPLRAPTSTSPPIPLRAAVDSPKSRSSGGTRSVVRSPRGSPSSPQVSPYKNFEKACVDAGVPLLHVSPGILEEGIFAQVPDDGDDDEVRCDLFAPCLMMATHATGGSPEEGLEVRG
jgi:hypothetical protein